MRLLMHLNHDASGHPLMATIKWWLTTFIFGVATIALLLTPLGCSKPAVPPARGGGISREERAAEKRRYVAELRQERAPIRGWVPSENAGEERAWGRLDNPISTTQTSSNVKASDTTSVHEMLSAADVYTNDILFAPPADDIRKLLAAAGRIVDWLVTKDASRLFPSSSPSQVVIDRLTSVASQIPRDKQIAYLRATADGRTYPKLSIDLERIAGRSESRLAEVIRNQYGYQVASIQNGILTAELEIPILSGTRGKSDLRIYFLYDKETADWILTSIEIRPDAEVMRNALMSQNNSEDRANIVSQYRANTHKIALTEISLNLPLVVE